MARCVQVEKRVTCTLDLAEGGTLRSMLENALTAMVAEHPEVNLTLQEYVPAFVDALIASANFCNQSLDMVDIAHELVEIEPTPEQCRIIIDAMKDFHAAALCACAGGSSAAVRETGPAIYSLKVHRSWMDKYVRTSMGRLWYRILKAMGQEEKVEVEEPIGQGGGTRG